MDQFNLYIAASYPRLKEAADLADVLEKTGVSITSDWHVREGTGYGKAGQSEVHALVDHYEVLQSHALYTFSEEPNISRGGRLVEVGIALAMSRPVIVQGEFENIFASHPLVFRFKEQRNALELLHQFRTTPKFYIQTIADAVSKLVKHQAKTADPSLRVPCSAQAILDRISSKMAESAQ